MGAFTSGALHLHVLERNAASFPRSPSHWGQRPKWGKVLFISTQQAAAKAGRLSIWQINITAGARREVFVAVCADSRSCQNVTNRMVKVGEIWSFFSCAEQFIVICVISYRFSVIECTGSAKISLGFYDSTHNNFINTQLFKTTDSNIQSYAHCEFFSQNLFVYNVLWVALIQFKLHIMEQNKPFIHLFIQINITTITYFAS